LFFLDNHVDEFCHFIKKMERHEAHTLRKRLRCASDTETLGTSNFSSF
jgi:hypothetical protein